MSKTKNWEVIPCSEVPRGMHILDSVWVLWQKQHIDKREIYKHKAHLNTALSTTEAEYIAISTTLQEKIPLMNLLQEVVNKGVLHKISTTNGSLQYF